MVATSITTPSKEKKIKKKKKWIFIIHRPVKQKFGLPQLTALDVSFLVDRPQLSSSF